MLQGVIGETGGQGAAGNHGVSGPSGAKGQQGAKGEAGSEVIIVVYKSNFINYVPKPFLEQKGRGVLVHNLAFCRRILFYELIGETFLTNLPTYHDNLCFTDKASETRVLYLTPLCATHVKEFNV